MNNKKFKDYTIYFSCSFLCFSNSSLLENVSPQSGHVNSFSSWAIFSPPISLSPDFQIYQSFPRGKLINILQIGFPKTTSNLKMVLKNCPAPSREDARTALIDRSEECRSRMDPDPMPDQGRRPIGASASSAIFPRGRSRSRGGDDLRARFGYSADSARPGEPPPCTPMIFANTSPGTGHNNHLKVRDRFNDAIPSQNASRFDLRLTPSP